MKHFLMNILIISLALTGSSFARILTKEALPTQPDSAAQNPERKLLVLNHYEDRRKDYEAAKCKSHSNRLPRGSRHSR